LTFKNRKTLVFIVFISLAWVFVDANDRFTNKVKKSFNVKNEYENIKLNKPQISIFLVNELLDNLKKYEKQTIKTVKKSNVMSVVQQAEQRGVLPNLYIGNNKIILKAIVHKRSAGLNVLQALILIINLETGEQELKKFLNNEHVLGYLLNIEKNTQVTLTKQQNQGLQIITLTMYKPMAEKNEKH